MESEHTTEASVLGTAEDKAAPRHLRLGDLLVQRHLVTPSQIVEALRQQEASGERLGSLLVKLGVLDDRELARALAEQMGVPLADLRTRIPEETALGCIPEALARSVNAIPLRKTGDGLEVAISDPADEKSLDQLTRAAGMPVITLIAPASDIRMTIDRSYRVLAGLERHVEAFQATEAQRRVDTPLQQAVIDQAPVVQIVSLLLTQALRDRASDIHIEQQEDRVRIRYRIDGALHDMAALPVTMGPAVVSRIKVMASMNIVERQRPQDGQFALDIDARDVNFRVSTTATIYGEKCVIRVLDKSRSLLRLEELGMPPDIQQRFSSLIGSPLGMVLCAGPTGSGKTTTLYGALSAMNHSEKNVMTIEDPVEYVFPSINQIQIREAAGVTFASGLRSILRQDPDIILVGEIRDEETARIAIQSALTGHFVLSSVHATDAITALLRFLDMGVEPFVLASSVLAVLAQRLIRRTCTHCKERYAPAPDEIAFWVNNGRSKSQFWRGRGCNFCAGTGYQDRIGVFELLVVDPVVKQYIVRGTSHEELLNYSSKEAGMRTLREQALALVEEDVTTIAEVVRAVYVQ